MSRKPPHAPGTPVDVLYLDGHDEVYLHGHVEEAEAARHAAEHVHIERVEYGDADEDDPLPRYGRAIHRYARWSFPDSFADPEYHRVLRVFGEPGRGAFKVTIVRALGEGDCAGSDVGAGGEGA